MAKENSFIDPKLELHNLVSNFYFSSKKEQQKIEKLIDRVNLIIGATKRRDQAESLHEEIKSVKRFQLLLNKNFSKIAMEFCQIVDQDSEYSGFQKVLQQEFQDLGHGKQMITDEKILLATQTIELYGEKQAAIKKGRKELEMRFLCAFPCERRKPSKEYIHDHSKIGIGFDSIRKVKFRETSWSWQILKGFDNDRNSFGLRPWNLEKVMTTMYGFSLDKVQREVELMRFFEGSLCFACKKHKDLTENNSVNKAIERKRSKLEALLFAIRVTKKCRDREDNDNLREAKEVLIEWLSHIEREIFFISVDLILLASNRDENGSERIRESFRTKLLALKRRRGGRVLVVVYRLIRFLEVNWFNGSENTSNNINETTEHSLMVSNINRVLAFRIYNMILNLMAVLYANVGLCCLELSQKEALIASVEIVERCDDDWRAIRMKIDQEILKNYPN